MVYIGGFGFCTRGTLVIENSYLPWVPRFGFQEKLHELKLTMPTGAEVNTVVIGFQGT